MTQKERLVELLKGGSKFLTDGDIYFSKDVENLADYLLSNGVIVPPCKVGEHLWVLDTDGRPREMVLDKPDIRCVCAKENEHCMATCDSPMTGVCAYRLRNDGTDIGKSVFLTREEAEGVYNISPNEAAAHSS